MPFAVDDMVVSKYLSGAVQVTEVEVDTRLGRIQVKRVWGGYGIGRRIVPKFAESQAEGGIIQGSATPFGKSGGPTGAPGRCSREASTTIASRGSATSPRSTSTSSMVGSST